MGFPKRISDLPNAGSLKNTDIFVLVNENDVTSQTTLGAIAAIVSGGSSTFTGNTLATCINQLWVHSISGCSPIQMGEIVVNGETTFKGSVNLSPDTETDIDFDNANSVSIPTYILKDCKGNKNDIVTLQNLSEYVGQVVTLASEGPTRWEVTLQPTLEVTSIEDCCFANYKISNCVTGEVWEVVNYEAWGGASYVGKIIKILEVEGCFNVTETCDEWTLDGKVPVANEYETCNACTATTYTLVPCDGWEGIPINTDTDLSDYVDTGHSIKEKETGICYTVVECIEDCEPTIPINYSVYLEGCEECLDNWQLTNCLGEIVGITTTQSELWAPGVAFSSSTTDGCFTADKIKQPANVGALENIIVVDCLTIECGGEPPTTYKLMGCDGLTEFFTDTDLSEYVGNYINAETLPGQSETCFYVTEELGESTHDVFEPQAIYTEEEGCDCCGQNPKWKYSACDDEEDQVVWENTTLGPLGIYAPPSCVRMSTDDGETWKCYNFMLCVPEEEPTEGITNFEVLEDSECCEGESCIPAPPAGVSFSFQPGEEEGIVEVYYTSNTELSGVNIQFRPGFTVISATGEGGEAGDAGFMVQSTSEIPLEEGSEITTSKVAMWSFAGATLGTSEESTLLCTLSISEDNGSVLIDNPISTIRYTTTSNNIGWEGTVNDYAPDSILNVLDVIEIWGEAMINYFGVKEVSSQYEAEGEPYDNFLVAGPETGGLELLVGTVNCILGVVEPPCSSEEPFISNYVSSVDIGDGSVEPWPIV